MKRHDFVFKYLVQNFKFELDQDLNSQQQMEEVLKVKKLKNKLEESPQIPEIE